MQALQIYSLQHSL